MVSQAGSAERIATRRPDEPRLLSTDQAALDHAYRLIHRVCCLTGSGDFVETVRNDNKSLRSAIERHDTPALFDWLMAMLSYQGISDSVAYQYMEDHGRITWADVEASLASSPPCPKLNGYWLFHSCRYHKASTTCAEPEHIGQCPLPAYQLRNGRLNQTASLYLFIRDIADGDMVGWIDDELIGTARIGGPDQLGQMREALLDPLRNIYGVSDKVLSMALSVLLMAAPKSKKHWGPVGTTMIAIDTLVQRFPSGAHFHSYLTTAMTSTSIKKSG